MFNLDKVLEDHISGVVRESLNEPDAGVENRKSFLGLSTRDTPRFLFWLLLFIVSFSGFILTSFFFGGWVPVIILPTVLYSTWRCVWFYLKS